MVSRDSKIEAMGSKTAPITFTSSEDITGETTGAGQWGGIVILGNAKSNKCPTDGSDCVLQVEGVEEGAVFGGANDEDSSGTLRYVVVKHAGYEIAPDNELNGVTFGGVGSGTKVEYLQVHENSDDGVEFFGGTVNLKYLVLTSNQDDSVDWDNDYRDNMQYELVKHSAKNAVT